MVVHLDKSWTHFNNWLIWWLLGYKQVNQKPIWLLSVHFETNSTLCGAPLNIYGYNSLLIALIELMLLETKVKLKMSWTKIQAIIK